MLTPLQQEGSLLLQECRQAYERLSSEAQYTVKQRCAEDLTTRSDSKAFMHAIYSITGESRPHAASWEGGCTSGADLSHPE